MSSIEQAIVLAAGEGQRLRPFTALRPKVMLPIANRPVLSYVVEAAARNGVHNIVMVVGYKKEQVQDYFGSGEDFGVDVTYVTQKYQVGTAQALKSAQALAAENFLVLSGDNIVEPSTIADAVAAGSHTILVKRSDNVSKYGVVIAENGLVKRIEEKPRESLSNLVNTGIYVFTKEVFSFIGDEVDLPSVLTRMAEQGIAVRSCETEDTWLDVVYPWDVLKLNATVLAGLAPQVGGRIERGTTIQGPVAVGKGSAG